MIKKYYQHGLDIALLCRAFFRREDLGDFQWEERAFVSGSQA
jgi:hypothetical protein